LEREADVMGSKSQEINGIRNRVSPVYSDHLASQTDTPVQRVVKIRADAKTGQWKYYSDRDPEKTLYDTQEEAKKAEIKLQATGKASSFPSYNADVRPPTAYSYAASHPTNDVSNEQGPHVVAYGAVEAALESSKQDIKDIFTEQVRSPDDVEKHLKMTLKSLLEGKKPNRTVQAQVDRMVYDYTAIYNYVIELIKSDAEGNKKEILEYIKWLINVDPQSSTNWPAKFRNRKYSVPKKKISGKGEDRDITNPKNVDTKSAYSDEAMKLWKKRKRLVESEDIFESEENEKKTTDISSSRERKKSRKIEEEIDLEDKIDIFNIHGINYAVNDPRIRDGGECFWDTLRHYGLSNDLLIKAVDNASNGVVIDSDVFLDRVDSLIQEMNKLGANIRIIIDIFDIGTGKAIDQKTHGKGEKTIQIGFAIDPETSLGHFVPPYE
jgi:hypothetical protein